ncbi:MAG: Crp/Fnr family transcriptional regulator [Mobilitalea sp.]
MLTINTELIKSSFEFWDKIDEETREYFLQSIALVNYSQGDNIYSALNDCVGVMLVKSGGLRTYILSEDGRDVTLYRLRPGDICILSASCLLKNITFDVYIDAEVDSEVYMINSYTYSKIQEKNVYVENFSLKLAVDRFSDVMWAIEQMLFMKMDRRLATFLFDEAAKSNTHNIKMTHEQMAKYVGSAREVISRMLKQFERDGLIEMKRGGLRITDMEKLKGLL